MIQVEKLGKVYQLGRHELAALKDVSFEIERGEYVAIMGPSGSGKSTLMNLLGCLDLPTTGKYRLESIDVQTLDQNQLAEVRNKRIGFVFQNFNLLPRATALENIELPLLYGRVPNPQKIALQALEKVGLADRAKHRPNELSGGERQRAAIARALVNQPAIILADEPTGNLDSKTGEEIMDVFGRLNRDGTTLIVVTHDPIIAGHSRRILKMQDGRLVGENAPC